LAIALIMSCDPIDDHHDFPSRSKAHLGRLFHSLGTTFLDVDFNLQG
jgi:hypothetical protein